MMEAILKNKNQIFEGDNSLNEMNTDMWDFNSRIDHIEESMCDPENWVFENT